VPATTLLVWLHTHMCFLCDVTCLS
jgi:hypothetical protein